MGSRFALVLVLAAAAYGGPSGETQRAIRKAISNLRDRSPGKRRLGAQQLAQLGPVAKGAVPHLVKALADDDGGVRWDAQHALVSIGAAGVEGLVKGLRHKDPDVRATLCQILARKDMVRAAGSHAYPLVVVLKDADADVRRAGVELFGAMGSTGIEALLSALKDRRPHVRAAASDALAVAALHAIPLLCDALRTSSSGRERAGICGALGKMGKKGASAADALVAALRDRTEDVRAEAARALGRTGTSFSDAEATLLGWLGAESEPLRQGSIDGLAAYGLDAAPGLVMRLRSKHDVERASAVAALYKMGRPAFPPLVEALHGGAPVQRREAIGLFVRFGALASRRTTLPGLHECAAAKDAGVRRAAADALGRLGRSRLVTGKDRPAGGTTVRVLLEAAKDADAGVRAAALTSLGRLGCRTTKEVLEAGRKDEDGRVRMAAYYALWAVGGDTAASLGALREGLSDKKTCVAAATALGDMHAAAEPATAALVGVLEHEQPEHRRAAADALGRIVRPGRRDVVELRGSWRKKASADVRKAIEKGLGWLAGSQDADTGVWDSDKHGGGAVYDPGTTGLALWALFSAGEQRAPAVRRGVDWLLGAQAADGVLGSRRSHSFLSYHAIAGVALAEGFVLTGEARYVRALEGAVDVALTSRNPGLAWRYEPRGGENDTHITMEMVTLLRLADLGGFDVDPEAYEGAATWIRRMTDPGNGQCGYNWPGGAPARPEGKQELFPPENSHAMTAAGVWCRVLLGGDLLEGKACLKGARLCAELRPRPEIPFLDQFYHQFGALAVFHADPSGWGKWSRALERTYVRSQEPDGSWAPDGVWGDFGGRVYSTAMAVLSLLVPYRYPKGFAADPSPSSLERDVVRALKAATKDDDPTVAAAATEALRRVEPR